MSRHRLEPPQRVRPRVRRLAAVSVSAAVTAVALLGGVGVIPLGGAGSAAIRDLAATPQSPAAGPEAEQRSTGTRRTPAATAKQPSTKRATAPSAGSGSATAKAKPTTIPARSGNGRRVVFSKSGQRVWLINAKNQPVASYLVSGSVTDNLDVGDYAVYSRSRWAVGIDDSGVMEYFVRFAHGPNAAIGFHSIPSKLGTPLQKVADLGTPQSHGCIRQRLSDAERMWDFASKGTTVMVVA